MQYFIRHYNFRNFWMPKLRQSWTIIGGNNRILQKRILISQSIRASVNTYLSTGDVTESLAGVTLRGASEEFITDTSTDSLWLEI